MGKYKRSIDVAFDQISEKVLYAEKLFEDSQKDAFEIRRLYQHRDLKLLCLECGQELSVSGSKYDRLHFKHKPGHSYCVLSDENALSKDEHEKLTKILVAKESERHIELKNKIGVLLREVDGVDKDSIFIDNRFIVRGNERRRPDVYCKYYDKELVFEIQLSDLSLRYILDRYEFYKKHGMYLIWILDNFDIHNQETLERDIKYLTKYENFFKLDEQKETFHLECQFKYPFLTEDNQLYTKWLTESIPLDKVKFDAESYQIYYFNFGDNKKEVEIQQEKRIQEARIEKQKAIIEKKKTITEEKITRLIDEIIELKKTKAQDFYSASTQILHFNDDELEVLNSRLGFAESSRVVDWISDVTTYRDIPFIEFILGCNEIKLDVNAQKENLTAFQAIYSNENISSIFRLNLMELLFQRGYRIKEFDKVFFSSLSPVRQGGIEDFVIYELCDSLTDKSLVKIILNHQKPILVIESVKRGQIVGFNFSPNAWLAFANNAASYYQEYWGYIELAFKKFDFWNDLIGKESFRKKVDAIYKEKPEQKTEFSKIIEALYPELNK